MRVARKGIGAAGGGVAAGSGWRGGVGGAVVADVPKLGGATVANGERRSEVEERTDGMEGVGVEQRGVVSGIVAVVVAVAIIARGVIVN